MDKNSSFRSRGHHLRSRLSLSVSMQMVILFCEKDLFPTKGHHFQYLTSNCPKTLTKETITYIHIYIYKKIAEIFGKIQYSLRNQLFTILPQKPTVSNYTTIFFEQWRTGACYMTCPHIGCVNLKCLSILRRPAYALYPHISDNTLVIRCLHVFWNTNLQNCLYWRW